MKNHSSLAAIALAVVLGPGAILVVPATILAVPGWAMAADKAAETVEGVVTKIDLENRRITVRNSDGRTYEFKATEETLKDFKVGDGIEAKRRQPTD